MSTVTLHRVFKAPPERMYRALTEPDALVRWIAPYGFTCQIHEIEVKVGGTYRMSFTNFGTGMVHSFGGTYSELNPGKLVRYTDKFDDPNLTAEMQTTYTITPVSMGSDLKVVQENLPEMIPAEMCRLGWQESLAQLALLVEPEIPDG